MATKILTISGSDRADSSNTLLLSSLHTLGLKDYHFNSVDIGTLPMYRVSLDKNPLPQTAVSFRKLVAKADAVIISTPEYIHNIPARLKNALEWLTTSGELVHKTILPVTYTPSAPRGEKAMQSLIWSLTALEAKVVTSLSLYQNEISVDKNRNMVGNEIELNILKEAIKLLSH